MSEHDNQFKATADDHQTQWLARQPLTTVNFALCVDHVGYHIKYATAAHVT